MLKQSGRMEANAHIVSATTRDPTFSMKGSLHAALINPVKKGARAIKNQIRSGFVRPNIKYPNFYYRYSHDISHVFQLQIFGIYAKCGIVKFRLWLTMVNLAVIFSPICAGIYVNHTTDVTPQQAITSIIWIVYFSFLALVFQACALTGVHVFHGLTPSLEKCLTQKGMKQYERWASISTALIPQAIWAAFCAVVGCWALHVLSGEAAIVEQLNVTWVSYFSVSVSAFYLSGGIWWIVAGSVLSVCIIGDGCLRLLPYAPAMTPGIELLVRCYRLAFVGACAGVALCLTPILTWTSAIPRSTVVIPVILSLMLLSFFSLVIIAILPDWMLSKAILRERHRLLDALNGCLPQHPGTVQKHDESRDFIITWMQTLTTTPKGTISSSAIVTIITALLSSILPLIIGRWIAS